MKVRIELEVEETSEAMAYQVLAIAIKKKFKNIIRPADEEGWKEICGQDYDY